MGIHCAVYIRVLLCFIFWIMVLGSGTEFEVDNGDCVLDELNEEMSFYKTQFQANELCSQDCIENKGAYWGFIEPHVTVTQTSSDSNSEQDEDPPEELDCVCCTEKTGDHDPDCKTFVKFGPCDTNDGHNACYTNCKGKYAPKGSKFGYCDVLMDCRCCKQFNPSYAMLPPLDDDDGSDMIGARIP